MGNQTSDPCIIDINAKTLPPPKKKYIDISNKQRTVSSENDSKQICNCDTPTITSRLSAKLTPITLGPTPSGPTPISLGLPIISTFPSTSTPQPHNDTYDTCNSNTTALDIGNGITGTHISHRITKIAAQFWLFHIKPLSEDTKLEIACSILFGTLSLDKDIRQVMINNIRQRNKNMEYMSLKYLDMIAWLIRHLIKNDIDLYDILLKMGIFHQKLGIKIDHFGIMLQAMHETFSYYFPMKYSIEVKYAMDEIFTVCAQIMSGKDLKYSPHLNNITKSFVHENNITFLKNLDNCLRSSIGREYLYKYLRQTFCDEIVLFLQTIQQFKCKVNAMQKFMVARDIVKISILPDAAFTLNVSFECRYNTLHAMKELERQFITKEPINIDADFFSNVEYEIYALILNNHWKRFVHDIKTVHGQSFGNMQ